ncbi:SH3 beta-barrel fold-containing protein [Mucilaginibacter sp. 10I4]|uniref:SH3 beta-barrel fold-containing protein n=1 Tax=Mucilaginibacter sp. 10I4 TaxID=3048580 RepID=UPI002B231B56|nr:SH3 beta-barrel fold-containing protein [Mucilaginibacter sp. 10I4]MEB0262904.1 SH3 beta-barrel fold-containing protein [Mucilaginibacter sp. 10I4]
MKKRLFYIAHAIKGQFGTFAEALVHAWKTIRLQYALCTQALVRFKYVKIDGSVREAVGTLDSVPIPKGGFKKQSYKVLTYFDLQQQEYRCARIENIIF